MNNPARVLLSVEERLARVETKADVTEARLQSIESKMDRAMWLLVSILVVTLVGMILRSAGINVPVHP